MRRPSFLCQLHCRCGPRLGWGSQKGGALPSPTEGPGQDVLGLGGDSVVGFFSFFFCSATTFDVSIPSSRLSAKRRIFLHLQWSNAELLIDARLPVEAEPAPPPSPDVMCRLIISNDCCFARGYDLLHAFTPHVGKGLSGTLNVCLYATAVNTGEYLCSSGSFPKNPLLSPFPCSCMAFWFRKDLLLPSQSVPSWEQDWASLWL